MEQVTLNLTHVILFLRKHLELAALENVTMWARNVIRFLMKTEKKYSMHFMDLPVYNFNENLFVVM